jgi:hypothetical protein
MRPESVRLNVVAVRNEARAAAAFWACFRARVRVRVRVSVRA